MKIAYISSNAYSDVDLSFIGEAQKVMDITYFVLMNPNNRRACALDLRNDNLREGINKGIELAGIRKYSDIVDIEKVFVLYSTSKHAYELKSFLFWYNVNKYLQSEGFDIIHYTTAPGFSNPFAYFNRKKVILTVHDPIPHSSAANGGAERQRKLAFRFLKNFILLNQSQEQEFISHYNLKGKNIYQSMLGCYTYLQKYQDNPRQVVGKYILFFGSINSYKGLDYLFPAMVEVHKVCPELKLVVAGGGKYYFDIEQYKQLPYFDIRNKFIPDNELAALIRDCEFVVVPYVDATQSGVVMSAYAYNKPCIATNVGGLPEMVKHGELGVICAPRSSSELASAMLKLFEATDLLNTYSSNIKNKYVNGQRSWSQIVKGVQSIYLKVNL